MELFVCAADPVLGRQKKKKKPRLKLCGRPKYPDAQNAIIPWNAANVETSVEGAGLGQPCEL